MDELRKLYQKQVNILEGLCGCLERERMCLIMGQTHEVWSLKEDKEKLCNELRANQQRAREVESGALGSSPVRKDPEIRKARKKVHMLKTKARLLSKDNVRMAKDTLNFIDELIGAMVGLSENRGDYSKGLAPHSGPRIICKEV